jgi:NAD(P)H-hydrate epimerase
MFKKMQIPVSWAAAEENFSQPEIEQALKSDLILDAILGTGFKPPLKGLTEKAIIRLNKAPGFVLAIDIPSGIDANLSWPPEADTIYVHADAAISFTASKPALVFGNLTEGPIAVAPIGSPARLIAEQSEAIRNVLTARDVLSISSHRPVDAHKGDFGHVLVIGGSTGKSGAAAMAGLAALRAGAGLVTVAAPKSVQPLIAMSAPELMTEPLPETAEGTISLLALAERERLLKGKSVVVIGPGISRNEETAEFVRDLVSVCSIALVIDADGLNAFQGAADELRPDSEVGSLAVRVLTPHPGEMSRLIGVPTGQIQSNRLLLARKTANETQTLMVLKGHRTVIANPHGEYWVNTTGNPGMAKGGSGDVLSGIVAAMLAQFTQMEDSSFMPREEGMDPPLGSVSPSSFFRWVSAHDADAEKIRALRDDYLKKKDPSLLKEIQALMDEKVRQAIMLVASLHVAKAVYLHGLAGDIAASLYGQQSMIATDIINCLGEAYAVCEDEAASKFIYLQR